TDPPGAAIRLGTGQYRASTPLVNRARALTGGTKSGSCSVTRQLPLTAKRVHVPVRVAHRGTPREINRQILLNLVRAWQPVSRADLARLMATRPRRTSLSVTHL